MHSPLPIMALGGPSGLCTPISETMSSVVWLKSVTAGVPAEPSAALQQHFAACGGDIGAVIVKRLNDMAHAVMPDPSSKPGPMQLLTPAHTGVERREEAVKLYYRVLESMLRMEQAASGARDFSALLRSSTFHACLLACSFEMVVAAYRMATLQVSLRRAALPCMGDAVAALRST